jgi:sugar lactone lactonase YvrE
MSIQVRWYAVVAGLAAGVAGCADGDPCAEVGAICTVAGNGRNGFGDPQGIATEQPLALPLDVAAAPDGRLYIVDFGNNCIRELDRETRIMRRVMGTGLLDGCPAGSTDCDALEIGFNHPTGITFDGGDALVPAAFSSQVMRVDLASGRVTEVYGVGSRGSYSGEGALAGDAAFDLPTSVVTDPRGGVLVLDQMNQVIRRIDPDGVIERVAGGCFTDDYEGANQSCTAADGPAACEDSDKLTCATGEGACRTPCLTGFAGDGGPAEDARFAFDFGSQALPARMTRAPSGELLIADTNNHRIRRIDVEGVITTAAGTGQQDGEGALAWPYDVAVDADGTLYVADQRRSCIQAVRAGGELEIVAGQCGTSGFAGDEGPASAALLDYPMGVEVIDDLLYIADMSNHRIRAVRLR